MRLILVFFLACLALSLAGQNFQTYRPGYKAFYERNDTFFSVFATKVKSGNGNDTIYYFPRQWKKSSDSMCALSEQNSFFLGSRMIKKSYTDHWYLNRFGDTLRFHVDVHAAIGSKYLLMQNDSLRFVVTNEDLSFIVENPILGVIQNLITQRIEVQDLNGNRVAHPFQDRSFSITQFMGFYKIFNIYHFPQDTVSYMLRGTTVPFIQPDVRGLYPQTIFDIRPGYERHFKKSYSLAGLPLREEKISLLTLDRRVSGDTIFLMHRRATEVNDLITGEFSFKIDSISEQVLLSRYHFLNAAEGELSLYAIAVPFDTFYRVSHEGLFMDSLPRFQEALGSVYKKSSPGANCLVRAEKADSLIFAENLGLVFRREEHLDTVITLRLQYYKRAIERWGLPFDFSGFVGVSRPEVKLKFYPNPVSQRGKLTFESEGRRSIAIYSMDGRLYFSGESTSRSFEINTNSWPSGMYFLRVMDARGIFGIKIVKF